MSLLENASQGLVSCIDVIDVSSEAVKSLLNIVSSIKSTVLKSQNVRFSVVLKSSLVNAEDLLVLLRLAKLNLLIVCEVV